MADEKKKRGVRKGLWRHRNNGQWLVQVVGSDAEVVVMDDQWVGMRRCVSRSGFARDYEFAREFA